MPKKQWCEPKLIILARSNPEEAVLFACKAPAAASGPYSRHDVCRGKGGDYNCGNACSDNLGS